MRAWILGSLLLVTGNLFAGDYWGTARWVWDNADGATKTQSNSPRYFRQTFDLSAAPKSALARITCDNECTLFINGEKVAANPAWEKVGELDVTARLKIGKNVIAIAASNQGGVAGAIAHLAISGSDGKKVSIETGPDWQVSLQETAGWNKPDFVAEKWAPAAVLGPPKMAPWNLSEDGPGVRVGAVAGGTKTATTYQSAEKELADFVVPQDFKIELVAAEPLVVNPVTAAVDESGAIYVAESHTYRYGPKGSPYPKPSNPIVKLTPKSNGKGYERQVVAEGFDDPVMGILVRDGKLWCTANNFLYRYDLSADGKATNRQTLLTDKNKAWNPFGMFVIEFGPDGWVYLSVGNHNIDIVGPSNSVTSRGQSGIVARMKPDGSQLERLVQGFRVPYSFEFDPYAQLWLLSNGEGNPNRFARVIDGVDYHCYSRTNENQWLIGQHPLAPPCFELPGGANTQLLRYYGAAWPQSFVGNLIGVNWGRHGFPSQNHTLFRYETDERNRITKQEPWLTSTDPHFRPTQILLAPDGNLLICDWYGRDDENDVTGRIWKLSYVGKQPTRIPEAKVHGTDLFRLSSTDHVVRERAAANLVKDAADPATLKGLREQAAKAENPLGAAMALWTLTRIGSAEAYAAISAGVEHADWRVRRLSLRLLRRFAVPNAESIAAKSANDADPAVCLEAAMTRQEVADQRRELSAVLISGAAADEHLRYEAASKLAQVADSASLLSLTSSKIKHVRLAGLIAIDVALFESSSSKPAAQEALGKLLAAPTSVEDVPLLIKLVQMNRDVRWAAGLQALLARPDLSATDAAQVILTLRSLSPKDASKLGQDATKKLLEAARTGKVPFNTPAEKQTLLELLAVEGPSTYGIEQLQKLIGDGDAAVRETAHDLARTFGRKATSMANEVRKQLSGNAPVDRKIELMATLAAIDEKPTDKWRELLTTLPEPAKKEVVRSWRRFQDQPDFARLLLAAAPELIKADAAYRAELAPIFAHLKLTGSEVESLKLTPAHADKEQLAKAVLSDHTSSGNVALGRQVFHRAGCTKCHTTVADSKLGPSLAGIGKAQKPEYLLEAILEPSKIIKTGFETETVQTVDGRVLSGLVREVDGDFLIIEADKETRVPKKDVEARSIQKKSLMPEGQEKVLSTPELTDLLAYLVSLKTGGAPPAKK